MISNHGELNQKGIFVKSKLTILIKWLSAKFGKNPINNFVKKCFYNQGLLISKYPLSFIIVPCVISLIMCSGLFKMKIDLNLRSLATPSNAYANYESQVFLDFFQEEGGLFYFVFGINAKDKGSLLRPEYCLDVLALRNYFIHNYSVTVDSVQYTFADLQVHHTDDNLIATNVMKYYNESSMPFEFTYPVMNFNGEQFYAGDVLRQVKFHPNTTLVSDMNMIWFYFNSARVNETHGLLLQQWALSFLKHKTVEIYPKLKYYYYNEDVAASELLRNCVELRPFVALAFGVVILFAFIVSSTRNPVTSKPWEALSNIIAVLLASGSGFGVTFYLGYPFVGTSSVIPILVLALGMDVTYITLRNWRSSNPCSPPDIRLAETLEESGCSVVITVLTNVLSAGIGCFTNILGIYIFCLILAISLTVLFFLQITLFPAFIACSAKRETANKHGWFIWHTVQKPITPAVETTNMNRDWWCTCSKFMAKLICTAYCRITVTLIMLAYWTTSIYCCYHLKIGLTRTRLLLPDSPLLETITLEEDVKGAGHILYITVSNPPNFNSHTERDMFNHMVDEFESYKYSIGSNATALWSRPYEKFRKFLDVDSSADYYEELENFLQTSNGLRWRNYIKAENQNGTYTIKKFFFTVVYEPTFDIKVRNAHTYKWRDIAAKYPLFNVTSWYEDNFNFVTDELAALPINTIQDLLITGLTMTVLCVMFIPNAFNIGCALITVFSINVGMFGYLMAWNVALDPVSMTSVVIAIGYSVDFTSHISYHYYTCHGETQEEKLSSALSLIGLPMLESGLSTLLCVACMLFVPSYIELVFFKNMLLVITIGLLHGLIILPTYLAWIPLKSLKRLNTTKHKSIAGRQPNIANQVG